MVLGVYTLYRGLFRTWGNEKSINRRLSRSQATASASEALEALQRERGFIELDHPLLQHLNDVLMQTGLKIELKLLVLAMGGLGVVLVGILGLVLGYGLAAVALAVFASPALTYLFLRNVRQRRIARFAEQLPDAIDLIVRGLRVGYPIPAALGLIGREMPAPIGPEFAMTADEIAFGQDIKTAVDHLCRRVGQEDLRFLAVAISVQSQTGGNLAEVLSRLSRLVRTRANVQLKIKALTAEGRISAKFLSLMPFILFAVVSLISPTYFGDIRDHPLVVPAMIYGAISLIIGNILMYRMVNFKF